MEARLQASIEQVKVAPLPEALPVGALIQCCLQQPGQQLGEAAMQQIQELTTQNEILSKQLATSGRQRRTAMMGMMVVQSARSAGVCKLAVAVESWIGHWGIEVNRASAARSTDGVVPEDTGSAGEASAAKDCSKKTCSGHSKHCAVGVATLRLVSDVVVCRSIIPTAAPPPAPPLNISMAQSGGCGQAEALRRVMSRHLHWLEGASDRVLGSRDPQ